jgi:hypothetical protein
MTLILALMVSAIVTELKHQVMVVHAAGVTLALSVQYDCE